MSSTLKKKTKADILFNIFNYGLMGIVTLSVVYPIYYCIILSLNNGLDSQSGSLTLWPRNFTLDNYQYVFRDPNIMHAGLISILRTVIGVVLALIIISAFSYAVSKPGLIFRKTYIVCGTITMYFYAGLIPNVILVKNLRLYDNFLIYILPQLFAMFFAILFISFFKTIPAALEESARIDGANDFTIFVRVVVPLTKPVFATVALFLGVNHWNNWLDTMLFTKSKNLDTLAHFLTSMLNAQRASQELASSKTGVAVLANGVTSTSLMLAAMVVTAFPIMILYPFLQRYFVKGVLVGSVKG